MTHPNQNHFSSQVESLQRRFAQSPGLPFADLLPADLIATLIREQPSDVRERIYTPVVTLALFLSQCADPDPSMSQAVARLLAQRLALGQAPCSSNTGGYTKARQRLSESLIAQLARHTGSQLMLQAPPRWCWQGRDVKIVDGATVSMPDTEANQAEYPQPAVQKPGLGFPILRFVVLFSLAAGTVLDAAFGPYQGKETGELALFRSLHDRLDEGDIVLADRYFCSFFEVAELQRRGIDVVMRQHQKRKTDFRRGQQLSRYDHIVSWQKPARPEWMDEETYRQYPAELVMRELRVHVQGKGRKVRSRTITIATTLRDPKAFSKQALAELYRLRWQAELNLRSLKSVMQMDVLRGQTPEMVRKELWAHFLAYNLIRQVMCQSATRYKAEPWQISFKGAMQTMNAFALPLLTSAKSEVAARIEELLEAVAQHRVGNRPNRLEPRAVKRRPKPHALLTKPRDKARKLEIQNSCG